MANHEFLLMAHMSSCISLMRLRPLVTS
jgi:hypothetical protein